MGKDIENMRKKRDTIEEILEINARLFKNEDRGIEFVNRYGPLYRALHYIKENIDSNQNEQSIEIQNELLRHFPVSLVATLEGYFRLLVRDVINTHEPFKQNLSKFADLKFDVSSVLAIDSSKISLGEFVAHILPLNDLAKINRAMSMLLTRDFLKDVKALININYYIKVESSKDNAKLIVRNLNEMFRIRHIICHEISTKEQLSILQVEEMFKSVSMFVISTDAYLDTAIRGAFDGIDLYERNRRSNKSSKT